MSKKSERTFAEGVIINQQRKCIICGTWRYQMSRYCQKCGRGIFQWGHPDGRRLPPSYYQELQETCQSILIENRDKQGIQFALKFCQRYLDKASKDSLLIPNPERTISELAWRGVTAEEMFLTSVSVYVYCSLNRHSGPWMPKHQIGNAIIHLRRWDRGNYGVVRGRDRREIGEYLYVNLKSIFEKFYQAIKANEQAKVDHEKMVDEMVLEIPLATDGNQSDQTVDNG